MNTSLKRNLSRCGCRAQQQRADAEWFRIPERGLIREGYFADVILFDAKTVSDRSTYESLSSGSRNEVRNR